MLIRAGRGNDPGGVEATQQGQLAVLCPACPHPGKNLPDNWDNEPVAMRYVSLPVHQSSDIANSYIDGFIRFSWQLTQISDSNAVWSPLMQKTLALLVGGHTSWKNAGISHISKKILQSPKRYVFFSLSAELPSHRHQRSVCVSHDAVNLADTKSSKGLAATGVGAVDCARHEFKLPNGVGDLQKGEKCYVPHVHFDHTLMLSIDTSIWIISSFLRSLISRRSPPSTSLMMSRVNGTRSYGLVYPLYPNTFILATSTRSSVSLSLSFILQLIFLPARRHFHSTGHLMLVARMAKHLNVDGLTSTVLLVAPKKWDPGHAETRWTTISETGIGRKLLRLVRVLHIVLLCCI